MQITAEQLLQEQQNRLKVRLLCLSWRQLMKALYELGICTSQLPPCVQDNDRLPIVEAIIDRCCKLGVFPGIQQLERAVGLAERFPPSTYAPVEIIEAPAPPEARGRPYALSMRSPNNPRYALNRCRPGVAAAGARPTSPLPLSTTLLVADPLRPL